MLNLDSYLWDIKALIDDANDLIIDPINDGLVVTHTTADQAESEVLLEIADKWLDPYAKAIGGMETIKRDLDKGLFDTSQIVGTVFDDVKQYIKDPIQDAWATHSTTEQDILDLMRLEFGDLTDNLTVVNGQVTGRIDQIEQGLWDRLTNASGDIWDDLFGIAGDIGQLLGGIGDAIGDAFDNAMDWIWSKLQLAFNVLRDVAINALDALSALPNIFGNMGDLMNGYFNISPEKYIESALEMMDAQEKLTEELEKRGKV